jgi:pyrimidine-nucleoside phosphorylase
LNPVELIRKKRDGGELSKSEIDSFFRAYLGGKLPDYQMSAMLMAIYFRSLSDVETAALCRTMVESGTVMDLSTIDVPKIDKHSTGGVGDKTSLIIAPIVSSLGVAVPMISGRGLGHTGGTLDKLNSIPNFNVNLSDAKYVSMLKKHHCALIGQTKSLAPLDKLLYALRDVTATIESIPLIASSIMSKKIASGLDGLVLDVKTGVGAFMQSLEQSRKLAKTLVEIGESYGKRVKAFITDMNEPLGFAVGNWLEVKECVECLQGKDVPDLMRVSLTLSGAMLLLADKCKTLDEGIEMSKECLRTGAAFEKFLAIAAAQGADTAPLRDLSKYPEPKHHETIVADSSGYISHINALEVGLAAVSLGAGRHKKEDVIDPKAGILFAKKVGDRVDKGEVIATVFTDKEQAIHSSAERIRLAVSLSSAPLDPMDKVLEEVK